MSTDGRKRLLVSTERFLRIKRPDPNSSARPQILSLLFHRTWRKDFVELEQARG